MAENLATGEQWRWGDSVVRESRSAAQAAWAKAAALLQTAAAFFFVATVTALVVRMLISSGVVVMFPLFFLLQVPIERAPLPFAPAIALVIINFSSSTFTSVISATIDGCVTITNFINRSHERAC